MFQNYRIIFSKVKYKKRAPFKRANNHRNSNDSFGNGSMNNSSRVTGSLSTVLEKYRNLAKDATSSGDYIGAENYLQHAEHYSRMLNERNARTNGTTNGKSSDSKKIEEADNSEETKSKLEKKDLTAEEIKSIN
ncbi:MAG: hypothetical protein CMI87_01455 [Pelagibacteraceae bacterium]|nr:hypothetical protein [Pelagibacteraceae bacterium]